MLLNNSFKLHAALCVGTLASQESEFRQEQKGEECVKVEADVSGNKENIENVDIGVLGCGEALICLEDESSSTGARCADLVEVDEGVQANGAFDDW
eukprot:scaffold15934_cov52-Cyclotella_meneghiniana.AAC.9